MARALIIIAGLGFLGFGIAALIDPVAVWHALGLPVADDDVFRIELRAFYGGLELGLGLALLATARNRIGDGLWLTIISYGSLGLGRMAGLLIDGVPDNVFLVALAVELGLALAAAAALTLTQAAHS